MWLIELFGCVLFWRDCCDVICRAIVLFWHFPNHLKSPTGIFQWEVQKILRLNAEFCGEHDGIYQKLSLDCWLVLLKCFDLFLRKATKILGCEVVHFENSTETIFFSTWVQQYIENYLTQKNQLLNNLLLPTLKLFRLQTCLVQHFNMHFLLPRLPHYFDDFASIFQQQKSRGHATRPPRTVEGLTLHACNPCSAFFTIFWSHAQCLSVYYLILILYAVFIDMVYKSKAKQIYTTASTGRMAHHQ